MEENRKFTVEIKSVNYRYFDVNIKMPKKLGFFESTIRNLLKEYMQRGKVDVFITYEMCIRDRILILLIGNEIIGFILVFLCLIIGYNLFCCR